MKQKNKSKSISKSKFEIIEKICIISFVVSITSFFLPNEFVVMNYICSAIGIVSVVTYLVTFCIYTRKNFESKYDYFFESNHHIQVQLKKFDIDCPLDSDFLISIIENKDLSIYYVDKENANLVNFIVESMANNSDNNQISTKTYVKK